MVEVISVPILLTTSIASNDAIKTSSLFNITEDGSAAPKVVVSVLLAANDIALLFWVLTIEKKDMSLEVVRSIPATLKRVPSPSRPLLTIAPA